MDALRPASGVLALLGDTLPGSSLFISSDAFSPLHPISLHASFTLSPGKMGVGPE